MKKLCILVLFFLFFLLLIPEKKEIKKTNIKELEKKAIFISYIELKEYLKGKDGQQAKKNIDQMIKNLSDNNLNMMILQVRSFSDSIYESKYFPYSEVVVEKEGDKPSFDILNYFIEKSHQQKIEVHAWINPYRIRNTQDQTTISKKNPAYQWLNTNHVKASQKGIYYNPASSEVQKLILEGIEELIKNYKIDGIHFDDYFYPDDTIDLENYQEYQKTNPISIEEYHLLMVNQLIKKVHEITKKNHLIFGISPEGNIENNYNKNYADVKVWAQSDEYVDYLMPQIYYGFYNSSQPFYDVLYKWDGLTKGKVKIIPALALYKSGLEDTYAKEGINEWIENDDIIRRQILLSRNIKNYNGFSIFRYSSMFNIDQNNQTVLNEIKNIKKVIKEQ